MASQDMAAATGVKLNLLNLFGGKTRWSVVVLWGTASA